MEHLYNHKEIEQKNYQKWLEQHAFESNGELDKKPYSIPLPPPNVTGILHLGHALNLSIQDALIRRKRMQGFDALWLPGTDHAGIATQAKVEEKLREKGYTRYELGREQFLEELWKWKEEYADNIHRQWASMGISVDYSKERFTLDEGLSKTVRKIFVELYRKGLIYQGERIINWDPVFKTALSDIEVEWETAKTEIYTLKYELEDGTGFIPVATTRPETLFGDMAIAVNPSDERYQEMLGKRAIVPIAGHSIPIIADEYPSMEFGTGAVKITPAHDANDFEVGKRHHLEAVTILNEDATLNERTGQYSGLDRFTARKEILAELECKNLLLKKEIYEKEIGYSERSKVEIEPRLSLQWFVKMDTLAENALKHQESEDKILFFPSQAENNYTRWISNIRDWCISRQLWWGHRIPVWYCSSCQKQTASETDPKECPHCESADIRQDEDVLDTWFSSALWAFSTLDWIDNSPMYKRYYPADALVTATDIIFFWVSRMIFMSLEFTEEKPFKNVLLHGLVLDENGKKMSKSKGNGIDPLKVIEEHGADALRFMLLTSGTLGSDLRYSKEKLKSAQGFGIKLWNSSRYIKMNLRDDFSYKGLPRIEKLNPIDKWILARLNHTIGEVNESFERYDFAKAGITIRSFFFNDYCDEYIEFTKNLKEEEKEASLQVLIYTLEQTLKLLHPIMPFLTEEIWENLNLKDSLIMLEDYPSTDQNLVFDKEEKEIDELIELISRVRALRQEAETKHHLPMFIKTKNQSMEHYEKSIRNRCKISFLSFIQKKEFHGKSITLYIGETEVYLPYLGLYDIQQEKDRLNKELNKWTNEIQRSESLLTKKSFLEKAKPEIIEREKEKLVEYKASFEKTKKLLEEVYS